MNNDQVVYLEKKGDIKQIHLPHESSEVIPGVKWGKACSFPTPAYWKTRAIQRRLSGDIINNKLGRTLAEETGACILGGYGIPSSVGLAAFSLLKDHSIFEKPHSEEEIYQILKQKIPHKGSLIRYRFARQKSKYLAKAIPRIHNNQPVHKKGKELRDWLTTLSGVGLKTASWITRNYEDSDDVAILDVHILRVGVFTGFFNEDYNIAKDYRKLEAQFIEFSNGLNIRPSELDAVIWYGMMSANWSTKKMSISRNST